MNKADVDKFLKIIRTKNGNDRCFECNKSGATWISIKHAVFVCTACAGKHRANGLRLKSILLDSFAENDLKRIKNGGNSLAREQGLNEDLAVLLDGFVEKDVEDLMKIETQEDHIKIPSVQIKEVPRFGKKIEMETKFEMETKIELEVEKKPEAPSRAVNLQKQDSLEIKRNKYKLGGVNKSRLGFGAARVEKNESGEKKV